MSHKKDARLICVKLNGISNHYQLDEFIFNFRDVQ